LLRDNELEKILSRFESLILKQEIEIEAKRPKKEVTRNLTWKCQMCGQCCKEQWGIFVTEKDVKRWMKEGRYDIIVNIVPVIRTGKKRFGFMSTPKGCIYLTHDNKCQIHDTKPEACQIYPFYLSKDGRNLLYDSSCPGFGKGERIDIDQLKRKIREHYLALERSGHQGFQKMLLKAQRKAFRKIPKSVNKEKILKFFQSGLYDEYFTLNIEEIHYHIVSINLGDHIPPKDLVSKWIRKTVKEMRAKAIIGILRVIDKSGKYPAALYCLAPGPVQNPKKIPIVVQRFLVDARARSAIEHERVRFVFWDEFYP